MKKFNLKNMICSILFFSLSFLQLSCISGGVGGATLSNSTQLVRIGEVTEIPLLATTKSTIVVPITNNSNDNVVLQSTRVQVNGVITTKFDQDNLIDISKCQSIIARRSCDMVVTPPQISGSFVINMTYVNSNGFQYKTSQFIRYSSNVAATNGFVYFNPEVMPKSDGVNTLSIPIILTENYSTLSIKSNQLQADQVSRLICPSNNYSLGTMCTVIVEYTNKFSLSNIENNSQVIISGDIKNSKRKNFTPITLSLTITNAGNIITSAVNTIINPTNSSMPTITLFNNGTSTVSNISIYGITPITIDQIGGCGTTLEVESSCTFTLSASSATANGASQVLISYINGLNQIKNLSFNVLYTTQVPSPHLYVASNGWLMNTTVNTVNYQGVYVANKGNVTLNNLQFGNISNISGMNYGGNGQTCVNGMSLAPESSCIMVVNYAPTAVVAVGNSINVVINASYYSQTNSVLSYISSVNIKYSANAASSGTFVAAGDYGAITSSVTTPAGAWTVQNNTPFTAAATTIERMVNNDTLQVIGTGGTAAGAGFIYQGEKGMIWQSASGGTNAPPTGATNRKITGLTYDSTNGYIVSNDQGAGDLYSITNITGVTPTWNTVLSGAFANQPFNLFDFGQSLAYLAPENTATAGQELDVATTNPTTTIWTAVNPTGAARAYKGAIYDGGRYCAFAANRFVSCATSAGFTTGSAWTQNGTAIYTSGTLNMVANNGSNTYIAALSASPFVVYISSPFTPESSITWTTAGTAPSAALIWVTFGGGKYIGVSAASPGLVWTSPDGNTWTQQTLGTANNPINAPYGFVYYDGTSYWASGSRVLRVSQNGVNWSNAGVFGLTYTYIGSNINYLAAGTVGTIESSANLTSWTLESSNTTNKLNTIKCFNSNNCYAVGENGTLLFSSDGAGSSWITESTSTNKSLNGIACGYGNCVVVGESGIILTESMGSNNWVNESSGTSQNLNSVIFFSAYNTYIAVGNGGVILISSNGIDWTQVHSGGNDLNSVACAYSSVGCMAVGTGGSVFTSISGVFWTAGTSATATSNAVTFYNGYWVLSQAAAVKYSLDTTTLTWNTITTGITNIAAMNMNAILAY